MDIPDGGGAFAVRSFEPCAGLTEAQVRAGGCLDVVDYLDVANNRRLLPVKVTAPVGSEGPLPVVVFQHGGGPNFTGDRAYKALAAFLASNGYLVVQMSVVGHCVEPGSTGDYTHCPAAAEQRAACAAIGITDGASCAQYTPMWFNRPSDASQTLTQLGHLLRSIDGAAGPAAIGLAAGADVSRAVMAGHSAGTAPTMMLAGAVWDFSSAPVGTNVSFEDPRFKAFVAFAPNPMDPALPSGDNVNRGWDSSAFASIPAGQPMLFFSGSKDYALDSPACLRRGAFFGAQAGNKVLTWVENAVHSTLALNFEDNATLDALAQNWASRNPCTDTNPGRTAADGVTVLDYDARGPGTVTEGIHAEVRSMLLRFLSASVRGDTAARAELAALPELPATPWLPVPTRSTRRGAVTP